MPFHRTRTPICLIIGEVFRCDILETWARLVGWKLVAPFNRFRRLLARISFATVLETAPIPPVYRSPRCWKS